MRKQTLAGFCLILAFAIVYVTKPVLSFFGVKTPFLASFAASLLVMFILASILMIPLTIINNRILAYRKEQGRDIEEEEKYESESGIISLRPTDKKDTQDNEIKYF